jgi:hypothetical protein
MSKPLLSVSDRLELAREELQQREDSEKKQLLDIQKQLPIIFEKVVTTGHAKWTKEFKLETLKVRLLDDEVDFDLFNNPVGAEEVKEFLNNQLSVDTYSHLGYPKVKFVMFHETLGGRKFLTVYF